MLEKHGGKKSVWENITACQESISALSASDNKLIIFRTQEE